MRKHGGQQLFSVPPISVVDFFFGDSKPRKQTAARRDEAHSTALSIEEDDEKKLVMRNAGIQEWK
jgi:hypothetical protein